MKTDSNMTMIVEDVGENHTNWEFFSKLLRNSFKLQYIRLNWSLFIVLQNSQRWQCLELIHPYNI